MFIRETKQDLAEDVAELLREVHPDAREIEPKHLTAQLSKRTLVRLSLILQDLRDRLKTRD